MTRMLIATDGSKFSCKAVDYGVSMASKIGAEVIGLYVINTRALEIYALEHHDNISGYESENARLRREGDNALDYLASRCSDASVKATTRIIRGHPAEDIVEFAGKEKVDMIVIGSLGKSGIEYLIMGSVSEAIIHRASCPVLIVRGDTRL